MFREMRRKQQQLTPEENVAVLNKGTSGVLALAGDNGYPYAVPLSYALDGTSLYFHSAVTGHKIDAIRQQSKASFCVIDMDCILPEKFTTCYRSVIAFGSVHIIEDPAEAHAAIEKLSAKYSPKHIEHFSAEFKQAEDRLCMLRLDIEHLTGKQARELMK
jgi:nitroimidazol reductase NimA-like FMN-containing flavoprotein (pyridoxamine 5'-phosphate oxidase superfamily)